MVRIILRSNMIELMGILEQYNEEYPPVTEDSTPPVIDGKRNKFNKQ